MRDIIFILILAVLALLGAYHARLEDWAGLSVDLGLAAFAIHSWRPWRRR